MRKWEDIVRDKMEEPEGALPESVFAEFRDRLDAAASSPAPKRFPLVWAVVPAVAAGLAAVLLLRAPAAPEGDTQIIHQGPVPVAVVADSTEVDEKEQNAPLIAKTSSPKAARRSIGKPIWVIPIDNTDSATVGASLHPEEESIPPTVNSATETESEEGTVVKEPVMNTSSPFLPEKKIDKNISMKVAPAAGVIAGGGLLAAITGSLHGAEPMKDASPAAPHGGIITDPDPPKDELTGEAIHYFPLKSGLSARFPVSGKLSITTGLDYSWYTSSFTYSQSGEKIQNTHYLGIPVRLDWTLAANEWLDVYLGSGFEGEWCLEARLAGKRISKDGFSASLQGAGGIQFKPTKSMGLYLEPQLNWNFASKNRTLETYRTEHPLMFSVAAGLRFTMGK